MGKLDEGSETHMYRFVSLCGLLCTPYKRLLLMVSLILSSASAGCSGNVSHIILETRVESKAERIISTAKKRLERSFVH